jgi:hypothetical protein
MNNSEWPMWRHDPGRTGSDGIPVYPPLKPIWQFQPDGVIIDSLAVADDLVCFGSKDKNIYALDATNGSRRWTQSLSAPVTSGPVVAEGQVFFCGDDGNVHALDIETGRERWRYQTHSIRSPAVGEGKVFVFGDGENLHCLDPADGRCLWVTQLKKSFMSIVRTPPVYQNGEIFVGGKKLRRVDATSGKLIQEARRIDNIACTSSNAGICGWKGGNEFMAAFHDDLDAINWELRGYIRWAVADEIQAHLLTDRRCIEALPTGDPALKWQAFIGQNLSTKLNESAYALVGTLFYVGTGEPACHAIFTKPDVLMKRWKMNLTHTPVLINAGGGRIFIVDDGNELAAFAGQDWASYERDFHVGDQLHPKPTLEATVLRQPAAKASDAIGPVSSFGAGYQLQNLKQKLRLEYRGRQSPFKERLGFNNLEPANWPNCCSLCCQPATLRRPLSGAKHYQVPYCQKCDDMVKSGQEMPAVSIELQDRDSREILRFRNERYWALFMAGNGLK